MCEAENCRRCCFDFGRTVAISLPLRRQDERRAESLPVRPRGAVVRANGRQGSINPAGKSAGLRGVLHSITRALTYFSATSVGLLGERFDACPCRRRVVFSIYLYNVRNIRNILRTIMLTAIFG
jgi:hypothetical protein